MIRVFKNEKDLGDKLAGRRNWCEVWEAATSIPARNQPLPEHQMAAAGSLVFTLRLEVSIHMSPRLSVQRMLVTASQHLIVSKPGLCKPFQNMPCMSFLAQP